MQRWRNHGSGDDGFTMIEVLMALVIITIIFVGTAATLQLVLRHQEDTRHRQQAAALATGAVEFARSVAWAELAMDAPARIGDPNVLGTDLLASAFDLENDEPLYVDATFGLIEAWTGIPEQINNQDFYVAQYVTTVDTDLRRVIVEVTWTTRGVEFSRHAGTLVSRFGYRQ